MGEITVRRALAADLPGIIGLLDEVDELHREALSWLLRKVDGPPSFEPLEPFISKSDRTALIAVTPDGGITGLPVYFSR